MSDANDVTLDLDDIKINFNCTCGETFICNPRFAGQKIACPACKTVCYVPDLIRYDNESQGYSTIFNGNSLRLALSSGLCASSVDKSAAERASNYGGGGRGRSFEPGGSNDGSTPKADRETKRDSEIPEILRVRNPIAKSLPRSKKRMIKNYRFISVLARGGMGRISLALDEIMERVVVLKEIRSRYCNDDTLRKRLTIEAKITGYLNHPGIVPVYSLDVDENGVPFYAMRKVDGITFEDAIKEYWRKKAPDKMLRELLRHFVAACQTVAYAHSYCVIHRDLKPSNVMIGKYGSTFVMDWGLALKIAGVGAAEDELNDEGDDYDAPSVPDGEVERLTKPSIRVGTSWYRDPDYLETGQNAPYNDVYSLGVMLYYLLTNKLPYYNKLRTNRSEYTTIQTTKPLPPAAWGVSRPLSAVCMKAIAVNPENRYRSVENFSDDIQRWLENEPVSVYRPSFFERLFHRD